MTQLNSNQSTLEQDAIRQVVAQTYTSALKEVEAVDNPSVVAKLAKYTEEELAQLPADAVENSFGCGNPLAFAGVKPGDTVVDLGSGAGIDLLLAADRVGADGHVIGIDMTDAMISKARANIAKAKLSNTEVRKGIIEALPVESTSVDWVISNCVINLSPQKDQVFAEIFRVLKPGGQMQISDIVMETDSLPDWLKNNVQLYSACVAGAISESGYLQGLEDAGLSQVKVIDRLYYDAATIKGLALSGEVPEVAEFIASLGERAMIVLDNLAQQLEGKIWSAKIYAQKPTVR